MTRTFDLEPSKPLAPDHAVAALIHTSDGLYLLQRRDRKRTIFYPDHWGCFGGAMEPGEAPEDALRRELREELRLSLEGSQFKLFGHFRFAVEPAEIAALDRFYYDVLIEPTAVDRLQPGEGAAMEMADGSEALHERCLVPYDAFALWLHYYQHMLIGRRQGGPGCR